MKNLISLSLYLLLFSLSSNAQSNVKETTTVDSLMNRLVKKKKVAGVAAGYSISGQQQWMNGDGYSNCKTKTAFEATTITRTASIAKPMTTVAILQLVEKGLIDLDLPIQTYLSDFPKKAKGEITTRQLIQHSAGIGGYTSNKDRNNNNHYASLTEASSIFKDRDLIAVPGEEHNYSTYGYVLLGLIIESASGMTYEEYLQKNIWDVAGMTNTTVEVFGKQYQNKSKLYHRSRKVKEEKQRDLSDRIPGGGVQSSISDLLKFGDALLNNSLISAESFELMITDSKVKKDANFYGLGVFLYGENPLVGNVVGHTGGQIGCSSVFFLLPDAKATVVVLSNTSGNGSEVSTLAVHLFKEVHSLKTNQ